MIPTLHSHGQLLVGLPGDVRHFRECSRIRLALHVADGVSESFTEPPEVFFCDVDFHGNLIPEQGVRGNRRSALFLI